MLWYQLSRWWAYRGIRHPEVAVFTTKLPAVVATLAVVLVLLLGDRVSLSGSNGILMGVVSVTAFLPGFFIAALAAVATFDREGLDQAMGEGAPKIHFKNGASGDELPLTYRMYMTFLFGHLSMMSIVVILASSILSFFIPVLPMEWLNNLEKFGFEVGELLYFMFKGLFIWIYMFFVSSIGFIAANGVFFLMERMHQIE